ncbi:hypothetical protein B0H11DRAFT_1213151 [Mycena galericulata]|nr:hypothetical protein B0H11DRAFT_1213151 [Mycena galericulata]
MHLTITPHNPINSTYRATDSGVEQYKVQTELMKVHDSVTTISRRIDSDVPRRDADRGLEAAQGDDERRFGLLAKIHWRVAGPSVIEFGGRELDTSTFFPNKSLTIFGWEPECTALDGKKYIWRKHVNRTTLELSDQPTTVVAEYNGRNVGLVGKARKQPSLEIFPPFEGLADEIMVTFIYVEKRRIT